ncbi:MAG: GNAT family N-acetyltransferase [Kofleriaceae bacterium]|nr:GNAT family N-acetyltransferase [Myxococcales bacterium]MCB9560258.1 GNAT family N-acetyltransferase [Kofleriaceae bacterium]MCB9571177.1 GNAT family N-acetyltransferase [Kofleriaceae bacterium]
MTPWTFRPWAEVSRDELYALLVLRARVFVVEQTCAYLDLDGVDHASHHLWCGVADAPATPVAYLRVVPPGARFAEPSLGRIVTAPEVRRLGLGRPLVAEGLRRAAALYGPVAIRIGAQRYLERFYEQAGFVVDSPEYDEDGIPHVEMLRAAGPPP